MKKLLIACLFCTPAFSQSGLITPEHYGALGSPKTCEQMGWSQSKIDSKFAGVGAKPYWTVDRAAWQKALLSQADNRKIIIPSKEKYYLDSMLYIDGLEPYMIGNKIQILTTNSGSWPFIGRRKKPTSRGEMEAMFSATNMHIEGFHFIGNGNNTGIEANCVRFAYICRNEFNNVSNAIKADFAMYVYIQGNVISSARNGIMLGLAIPGDNESSSNVSRVIQNICHTCSDTAFANKFAYEVVFDQNTIEGNGNCKVGFYGDMSNKTTGKDLKLGSWHLEQTGTAQIAWFKIKLRDQTVYLHVDNVHDATNGLLVDIESTNAGMIIFSGLNWFDEAKYFKTKGATWKFHYCKAIGNSNKNTIWFTDTSQGYTSPPEGKASAVGVHSYEIVLSQ